MYHLLLNPSPADLSKGYPAVKGPSSKLGRLWKLLYQAAKVPSPKWLWALDDIPESPKAAQKALNLSHILEKVPPMSHCIIGNEELLQVILGKKGIDDWCGAPYEAHGRTWWPILDMYRIDQNPALYEPVRTFLNRAHVKSQEIL
jgi:hypothetical protein